VQDALCGREAARGVHEEASPLEIHCLGGQQAAVLSPQVIDRPPGHGGKRKAAEARVLQEELHVSRRERSHGLLYDVKLINLVLAREQGLPVGELAHDAPNRPHVDREVVLGRSKQQLWGAIPACCNVVGQIRLLVAHCSCKAKIAEFHALVRRIDEQVLRLDISVNYAVAVAPFNRHAQLKHEAANHFGIESVRVLLKDFQQIPLHVLEHQVQLASPAKGVVQMDDVALVAQHPKQLDLPKRRLLHNVIVCSPFDTAQ
jgi:hypothetical protein